MNKESVTAIILGLVLGALVAFGAVYYTVNKQKKINSTIQNDNNQASKSGELQPSKIPPTVMVLRSLEITSPQSGSITQDKSTSIKGVSGANTFLIVQSPIKTQTQKTTTDAFSIDFPLALGENVITISAYGDGSAVPVQKKLYIYRLIP